MNIEEAIKTIEIAIAEVEWEYPMNYAAAFDMALAAIRAKAEAEKNEPLTLEELLEMDGEPVWVETPCWCPYYSGWYLVNVSSKDYKELYFTSLRGGRYRDKALLGSKIYRRKPEECGK